NKATLTLTRPAWSLQSYAEDSPARGDIAIRQPAPGVSPGGRRSLLRCMAEGLFVSNYDVRGNIAAFRHGF
ncbi:hypothetical protein BO70DRAFT_407998, partial [Aspergillus heteromorphus CBS 117.55]